LSAILLNILVFGFFLDFAGVFSWSSSVPFGFFGFFGFRRRFCVNSSPLCIGARIWPGGPNTEQRSMETVACLNKRGLFDENHCRFEQTGLLDDTHCLFDNKHCLLNCHLS